MIRQDIVAPGNGPRAWNRRKNVTTGAMKTVDQLSESMLAAMDRAVRGARARNWCSSFNYIASDVFEVAIDDIRDSDGRTCDGYDREGYDSEGFNYHGYSRDGYTRDGFDDDGYDREGYDRSGINRDGVDRQGRDKYRYDSNGWTHDGYDSNGVRRRAGRDWYAAQEAKDASEFRYDPYGYQRQKN